MQDQLWSTAEWGSRQWFRESATHPSPLGSDNDPDRVWISHTQVKFSECVSSIKEICERLLSASDL